MNKKQDTPLIAVNNDALAGTFDLLLNNTLMGFKLIDKDYKVLTCNKTAQDIYSSLFKTKLVNGTSLIKVLPDYVFPAFHKNFKKALNGNQILTKTQVETKKGTRYFDFNYA